MVPGKVACRFLMFTKEQLKFSISLRNLRELVLAGIKFPENFQQLYL